MDRLLLDYQTATRITDCYRHTVISLEQPYRFPKIKEGNKNAVTEPTARLGWGAIEHSELPLFY